MIVCTSCKTSYNVLSHSHWELGQFAGGGGGGVVDIWWVGIVKKSGSPDFRFPEVSISAVIVKYMKENLDITNKLCQSQAGPSLNRGCTVTIQNIKVRK